MERWVFFEVKWLSEMGFGVAMTAAMMMDEMDVFGRILDDAANPGSGGSGGMSIALMEPPPACRCRSLGRRNVPMFINAIVC